MGNIRKINDEYYIEFQARGLLYQQKAGKDIARARQLLAGIESKIQKGEMGTLARDVDIDIFFQTFLESARQEYAPRSFRRFEAVIGNFHGYLKKEFSGVVKLSGVTPAVIDSYRAFLIKPAPLSAKPNFVNFALLLLRVVLDHGLKLGYINDNPTIHVRFCEFPRHPGPATLTDHDLEKLLESCSVENKDLFTFLAGTGVRAAEALELRWQNVDSSTPLRINPEQAKRVEWVDFQKRSLKIAQREVPMDMDVFALLERKAATGAANENRFVFAGAGEKRPEISELEKDLARSLRRCKLAENIHLRTFRHSFVRRLLEGGVAPVRVCRLMGFEDIARIMYYWQWVPVDRKLI